MLSTRRAAVFTFALLGATASCRDATAPKDLTVALSVDSPPVPQIAETPNGAQITCNVNLTATAQGKGSATWGNAIAAWYVGKDRRNPVGTTTNDVSDVVRGFSGRSGIASGETLHTTWYFYDSAPFTLSLSFAYTTDDGQSKLATTKFNCGPDASNAVPPTLTQVTVPMTGDLVPGQTISVSFQASSPTGIWETVVDASGAFLSTQRFPEQFATNVSRTVNFVVPSSLNYGVPLTISVRAIDAALEATPKSIETQLKAVDRSPPVLGPVRVNDQQGLSIAGQFAVGDTMSITAEATDNELAWLVYELGPPINLRDSVAAPPGVVDQFWTVPLIVQPNWVGTAVLSVYARDAAGLTSQVVSSLPDSIRFFPVANHTGTTPLLLSSNQPIGDMVYDARRDLMYVGIPNDNRIVPFTVSTMTAAAPIVLPGAPSGMDLSVSGDSLLVAVPSAGEILVLDLTNPGAPPDILKLTVLDTAGAAVSALPPAPDGLRIAANGKMIVTLSHGTKSGDLVVAVDLATGAQSIRSGLSALASANADWAHDMGRTPDRSRIYLLGGCKTWYDAATDAFALCGPALNPIVLARRLAFDSVDTRFGYASFVLDESMQNIWSLRSYDNRIPSDAVSPDGATIYLGSGQGVTAMRFADKTMLERFPIWPGYLAEELFIGPGGKWALAFQDAYGARVSRVDLQ